MPRPRQGHKNLASEINWDIGRKSRFLPRDAMRSADYAVARCLFVCLSHAGILSKRLYTYSNFFSQSGIATLLHTKRITIFGRGPLMGASNARGMKNRESPVYMWSVGRLHGRRLGVWKALCDNWHHALMPACAWHNDAIWWQYMREPKAIIKLVSYAIVKSSIQGLVCK